MSAKLLYSLSDDGQNLQKQFGCMNGFLQFFDRNHLVNSQGGNIPNSRRLLPGEVKQQGRAGSGAGKKPKGKFPNGMQTQLQGSSLESSRVSVSSSSASTAASSNDRDWSIKNVDYLSSGRICTDKIYSLHPSDSRVNQPYSSPYQPKYMKPVESHQFHKQQSFQNFSPTSPSPIKTAPREQAVRHTIKHVDSPRYLQASKLESPKFIGQTESFRSISSNQSAPILPHTKKDAEVIKDPPRFSFDGKDPREIYISSLKLRDLPRLSLDSRQQTIKKSVCNSRKDDVLRDLQYCHKNQNQPEEPGSSRPPSNIVAKLMGLDAVPDSSPSIKSRFEKIEKSDFCSRSSRTIDESKVSRVLYSPRNSCQESNTSRSNKGELAVKLKPSARAPEEPRTWKQQQQQAASAKSGVRHVEDSPEQPKQTITVYGAIERRLNDLDFKRSGKDLRALKQILESMHREKTDLLSRKENRSSDYISKASTNSFSYISQKQGATETHSKNLEGIIPTKHPKRDIRSPKDSASSEIKRTRSVKKPKEATASVMQELPPKGLHRIRLGQHSDGVKDSAPKKSTKYSAPEAYPVKENSHQTHYTVHNVSGRRSPKIKPTSKAPLVMTTVNVPSPAKISRTVSSRMHSQVPVRNMSPGSVSQGNTTSSSSDSRSILVSEMHKVLASADQSGIKYNFQQLESKSKNAEELLGGTSPTELRIAVRELPSPVSVLDAMFCGEESPSPVKKRPTAFTDYGIDSEYTGAEWNGDDLTYLDSLRPAFSQDQRLQNFNQSAPGCCQVYSATERKTNSENPDQEEENPEKWYVSEILSTSGFLDNLDLDALPVHAIQSDEAINSSIFYALEQLKGRTHLSENRSKNTTNKIMGTEERHQRKLLFDIVNEILSQRVSSAGLGSHPQLLLKRLSGPRHGRTDILQEIYEEISLLHKESLHQSSYDEDDFLTTIIGKDFSSPSGNWTDLNRETPGLALDIERLIFKDLIEELVC